MSAPKITIELTFAGILFSHLLDHFPGEPTDQIESRVMRLIRSCKPANEGEESAWRESLADVAARRRARGSA